MKTKSIDCIALKHKIQEEISKETKKMNTKEMIEYFKKAAEKGPFSYLIPKTKKKVA